MDIVVYDSLGHQLHNGDTVILIKDLKLKGTNFTLKRGLKLKNITIQNNIFCIKVRTKQYGLIELKNESIKLLK